MREVVLSHDLLATADAAHEPVRAPTAFDTADEFAVSEHNPWFHRFRIHGVSILSHCVKKRIPARFIAASNPGRTTLPQETLVNWWI